MTRIKITSVLLVLLVLVAPATLAGCGASSKSSSSAPTAAASGEASSATVVGAATGAGPAASGGASASKASGSTGSGGSGLGQAVTPAQPKIIRTGDVHVQVAAAGGLVRAFDAVSGLATGHGGFVSDSTLSPSGDSPSARLVLRVANDQVDAVLGELAKIGKVTDQTLGGQDVTGQVVDLNARITTLQAEEDALRTLLGRAQQIGDILQIQNQLFELQSQVEQLSGQQNTLAAQTSYATLSVELTAPPAAAAPGPKPRPTDHPSTIARAWTLAGHHTVAVLRALVLALGWSTPVLVGVALAGVPLLLRWRRRAGRAPGPGPVES
jgi:hypothetical protein